MFKKKIIFSTIVLLLATNLYAAANLKKPTLILVHGALLTSSIWMPVQSYLQNKNYNVVTLDVPGRADDGIPADKVTLYSAATKVCKVAKLQHGPVILVGHSQGGAIITQAISECGRDIKGLVYIAAVIPFNGEKAFEMLSEQDAANFDQCATLDKNAAVYKINSTGPIKDMFMADASSYQAEKAINNFTPEPAMIGEGILRYNQHLFNEIPKFYIETTNDKIISLQTQKKIQSRVEIRQIYTMKTSHAPFISQPKMLGKYLAEITDSVSANYQ